MRAVLCRPRPASMVIRCSIPSRSAWGLRRCATAGAIHTFRRHRRERGSKRAWHEAFDNCGHVDRTNRLLEAVAELLRTGAGSVVSESARDHVGEMAEFYQVAREATRRSAASAPCIRRAMMLHVECDSVAPHDSPGEGSAPAPPRWPPTSL